MSKVEKVLIFLSYVFIWLGGLLIGWGLKELLIK